MTISTVPLSPTLGVEVRGLNTKNPSELEKTQLRDLFLKHRVILIREANVSEDEHLRLAECIGPISSADANMKDGRKFTHISNVHEGGRLPEGELLFHSDHMFLDEALRGISLFALEVPSKGGETCFLDAGRAHRSLPEDVRKSIAGLSALHVYDYSANRGDRRPSVEELQALQKKGTVDMAIHPIVSPHPETGEPILYVSRLFTVQIMGWPRNESDALLETLFNHLESHGADYVHPWRVGDLIIWDNCALQHSRNDFDPKEKRALRRVPIGDGSRTAKAA